ncbi:MAG TPA: M20/M25/M40 family metallo-hydrolase [Gemmatimonadaceae bacterium]|jgi:acetylornithine deacetylase/succinyl-diaminopimelate desuccinylase-like protein
MRRTAFLLFAPIALAAQQPTADSPALARALAQLKTDNAWTLQKQVALCEIPAPPFKEQARGLAFQKEMLALGYADAHVDQVGNVVAELAGVSKGPTVVIAGHLDTVFPEGTNVAVTRDGTRYKGAGIGDDCRGLAVVLSTARAVKQSGLRFAGRVIFVANVGEEGPGNLRGTRHLLGTTHKGQVDYFISVDGAGNDIVSRAVGSNRYNVHFRSPGGHSYGAFGMPNPIHAMGRAIATISDIKVPRSPKTTFNVGIVSGGTSVNSIAMEAVMDVDMRSESAEELAKVDVLVRKAIDDAVAAELARWPGSTKGLTVRLDTIGIRPTGAQSDSALIVRTAVAAARQLGLKPSIGASSTDSNYPISLGIPAITIDGGGDGNGAHSHDEWYDDGAAGYLGPQWALRIIAALAGTAP